MDVSNEKIPVEPEAFAIPEVNTRQHAPYDTRLYRLDTKYPPPPPPPPSAKQRPVYYDQYGPQPRFGTEGLEHHVQGKQQLHGQQSYQKRKRKAIVVIVVAAVILAAVLGGVLGSRRARRGAGNTTTPSNITAPTVSAQEINAGLPDDYVKVDSPLIAYAFRAAQNEPNLSPGPTINVLYQMANNGFQRNRKVASGSWRRLDRPMFTDAKNNSGAAVYVSLNGTYHQQSIFYISKNQGEIWEKRLYPNETEGETYREGAHSLGFERIDSVPGDTSIGAANLSSPRMGWGPRQLAGVYSPNFSSGPSGRVFYHQENATHHWIRESIWRAANDSWTAGARIFGAARGSKLSAVVDESVGALRLFYAAEDADGQPTATLAEVRLNITDPAARYRPGIAPVPDLLVNPAAQIAAVYTRANGTLLYYAALESPAPGTSRGVTVRELQVPDEVGATVEGSLEEASTRVAMCDLMAANTDGRLPSIYVPLGTTVLRPGGAGEEETVYVFWAEGVEDQQSGYESIKALSRTVSGTWDEGQAETLDVHRQEA